LSYSQLYKIGGMGILNDGTRAVFATFLLVVFGLLILVISRLHFYYEWYLVPLPGGGYGDGTRSIASPSFYWISSLGCMILGIGSALTVFYSHAAKPHNLPIRQSLENIVLLTAFLLPSMYSHQPNLTIFYSNTWVYGFISGFSQIAFFVPNVAFSNLAIPNEMMIELANLIGGGTLLISYLAFRGGLVGSRDVQFALILNLGIAGFSISYSFIGVIVLGLQSAAVFIPIPVMIITTLFLLKHRQNEKRVIEKVI